MCLIELCDHAVASGEIVSTVTPVPWGEKKSGMHISCVSRVMIQLFIALRWPALAGNPGGEFIMVSDCIADTGWFSRKRNSCSAVPRLLTALHRYCPKCLSK